MKDASASFIMQIYGVIKYANFWRSLFVVIRELKPEVSCFAL